MKITWKPHWKRGKLTERADLPDSVFAYPEKRKEPMTNASHVRNAIARFPQVKGVLDHERDLAFANIKKAAKHYGVNISETNWEELRDRFRARTRLRDRKKSGARKAGAKRAAVTRKKTARKKATTRKKATARKKTASRKKAIARKTTTRKKSTRRKKA
jgi:hypothetical protein